jgi:hypothetical protein
MLCWEHQLDAFAVLTYAASTYLKACTPYQGAAVRHMIRSYGALRWPRRVCKGKALLAGSRDLNQSPHNLLLLLLLCLQPAHFSRFTLPSRGQRRCATT